MPRREAHRPRVQSGRDRSRRRPLSAALLAVSLLFGAILGTPGARAQSVQVSAGGPYTGAPGQPIVMTGSLSAPGVVPFQWLWTFGDGTTATGQSVQKIYTAPGSYTVTVQVQTSQGSAVATTVATVGSQAATSGSGPISAGGPYVGAVGQLITMTASVNAFGLTPAQWVWNFGDGSSGIGQTVQKIYAVAGTYTVTVSVPGQPGFIGGVSATTTATIGSAAAVAAATAAATVMLVGGCSNVIATWPDATPPSTIVAAVSPPGAVTALWRYDTAAGRFLAYAPSVRAVVNDLLAVNRLDALFICVTTPATLVRPITL